MTFGIKLDLITLKVYFKNLTLILNLQLLLDFLNFLEQTS